MSPRQHPLDCHHCRRFCVNRARPPVGDRNKTAADPLPVFCHLYLPNPGRPYSALDRANMWFNILIFLVLSLSFMVLSPGRLAPPATARNPGGNWGNRPQHHHAHGVSPTSARHLPHDTQPKSRPRTASKPPYGVRDPLNSYLFYTEELSKYLSHTLEG